MDFGHWYVNFSRLPLDLDSELTLRFINSRAKWCQEWVWGNHPSLDTCHGPGWAISGDQWWSVKLWARGESLRTLKWWRAEGYLEWSEWPGEGLVISHGLTMENWECLRRMYHRLMMRTVYMYSVQSSWQNRLLVRWKCHKWARGNRKNGKRMLGHIIAHIHV